MAVEASPKPARGSGGSKQNKSIQEAVKTDLTAEEHRELFGEDEQGNLLPDEELNAIVGPAYADIFAKKQVKKQPTAQKPNITTTNATANSKKKAQKVRFETPVTKTNTPQTSEVSKPSAATRQATTAPKSTTKTPPKPPKQKPIWNSALALTQEIEVYKGVKVETYCGYDGIRQAVGDIELEDETVTLRILRHADGWLELIVAGLLDDGRKEMGKKMHGVKDTSVLELTRRVAFREDVLVEEFTEDDALDAIGIVSAEFDRDRIMAVLYLHPDGLVEYVVSGPVLQTEVAAQVDTSESDSGVSVANGVPNDVANNAEEDKGEKKEQGQESQNGLTADDGLQMSANESDKSVLGPKIPSTTSTKHSKAGPKTGKRKRSFNDDNASPEEYTAPQPKKSRTDQVKDGKSEAKRSLVVVLKIPSQKLRSISTPQSAVAVGGSTDNDENSNLQDTSWTKKNRKDQEGESRISEPERLISTPKTDNPDAALIAAPNPAAAPKGKRKADDDAGDLRGDSPSQSNEILANLNEQSIAGRTAATPNKSNRTKAPTIAPASTPTPKGKRRRIVDEEESDSDDDLPLVKRVRTAATNLTAGAKDVGGNGTHKQDFSARSTEQGHETLIQGHDGDAVNKADEQAAADPNTATVPPHASAAIAEIIDELKKGPSKAPTHPDSSTPTTHITTANEESITAPTTTKAPQPPTANAEFEENNTTAPSPGQKSKRPVKKATGPTRNKGR